MLTLTLVTAAALSGCQTHSQRYQVVQKRLKESYKNGDITKEEYDESLDRYRKAAKGDKTDESAPDGPF